jgi:hypothetical protein
LSRLLIRIPCCKFIKCKLNSKDLSVIFLQNTKEKSVFYNVAGLAKLMMLKENIILLLVRSSTYRKKKDG